MNHLQIRAFQGAVAGNECRLVGPSNRVRKLQNAFERTQAGEGNRAVFDAGADPEFVFHAKITAHRWHRSSTVPQSERRNFRNGAFAEVPRSFVQSRLCIFAKLTV
jgi:hypothetical protein